MSEVWDEALDEEDVKKEILLDENVPYLDSQVWNSILTMLLQT